MRRAEKRGLQVIHSLLPSKYTKHDLKRQNRRNIP